MKKKFSLILIALLLVLALATCMVACDPAETPEPTPDPTPDPTPTPGCSHQWSAWSDNGDGTCSRVCALDNTHKETVEHSDANVDELCDNCSLDLYANRKVDETGWNNALTMKNEPNFTHYLYDPDDNPDTDDYELIFEVDKYCKYWHWDSETFSLVVNAGNYVYIERNAYETTSTVITESEYNSFYTESYPLTTLFPFADYTYNASTHCYEGLFGKESASVFFENGRLIKLTFLREDGDYYEHCFTYGTAAVEVPDIAPEGFLTVTLDYQDGVTPNGRLFVEPNSKIGTYLPALEGDGFKEFKGWYKTADGTGKWLSSTKVTENITLYAIWKFNAQEVVFDLNYEGAPKPTTEYRPMGMPLDLSNEPTRDYWVFSGWYTDAELTNPYDVTTIFTNKTTLYASWTIDPDHVHSYEKTVIPVTCTTDGYDLYTCVCSTKYTENVIPATGHKLDFEEGDYFGMAYCSNEDCNHTARRESERIYEDIFVYNFDESKKTEIDRNLTELLSLLNKADRYDAALHAYDKTSEFYAQYLNFIHLFNTFYDDIMYLTEQYQYAYVFYCVSQTSANVDAFTAVSDFRTEKITDFYSIYRLVYETSMREYFYDKVEGGWTDEDIEEALALSDSHGNSEYAAINNRLTEIELRSQELNASSAEIPALYEEFVSLKNQLAALMGYDDYLEYAYASEYGRDYTPEESKLMRSYVKEYLVDVYKAAQNGANAAISPELGSEAAKYLAAFNSYSVFDSALASNLIKDYFKVMTSDAGEKDIDFYYHANELFKNGNYFRGSYSGAYSYWIPAQQATILYFGPTSYSASFTFVHEFGHYYNNVYNPNASMALDIDEVHSQGNEMMFLAYLEEVLPKEILRGMYAKLYYGQLEDMLNVIMKASAIDEFEYCVYNGVSYLDGVTPVTYTKDDYDSLFINILSTYGIGSGSSNYWRSVAIRSSGYYISYAMSALPCVELLSVAETEGFEAAKSVYLKFFTFTDDPNNAEVDSDGDKVATLTFAQTLQYAGLHSVFEEDMYTYVSNYFLNTQKDFTYAS